MRYSKAGWFLRVVVGMCVVILALTSRFSMCTVHVQRILKVSDAPKGNIPIYSSEQVFYVCLYICALNSKKDI